MDPVDMRALIRGAVEADILTGWYWYTDRHGDRRYILSPCEGDTHDYSVLETEQYCQMLQETGIEPIYHKGTMQ